MPTQQYTLGVGTLEINRHWYTPDNSASDCAVDFSVVPSQSRPNASSIICNIFENFGNHYPGILPANTTLDLKSIPGQNAVSLGITVLSDSQDREGPPPNNRKNRVIATRALDNIVAKALPLIQRYLSQMPPKTCKMVVDGVASTGYIYTYVAGEKVHIRLTSHPENYDSLLHYTGQLPPATPDTIAAADAIKSGVGQQFLNSVGKYFRQELSTVLDPESHIAHGYASIDLAIPMPMKKNSINEKSEPDNQKLREFGKKTEQAISDFMRETTLRSNGYTKPFNISVLKGNIFTAIYKHCGGDDSIASGVFKKIEPTLDSALSQTRGGDHLHDAISVNPQAQALLEKELTAHHRELPADIRKVITQAIDKTFAGRNSLPPGRE